MLGCGCVVVVVVAVAVVVLRVPDAACVAARFGHCAGDYFRYLAEISMFRGYSSSTMPVRPHTGPCAVCCCGVGEKRKEKEGEGEEGEEEAKTHTHTHTHTHPAMRVQDTVQAARRAYEAAYSLAQQYWGPTDPNYLGAFMCPVRPT